MQSQVCCALLRAQNVRVVQRNLVYVVGLALELCYEDLLKGPEYFGQFGKVVKVLVLSSRSSALRLQTLC